MTAGSPTAPASDQRRPGIQCSDCRAVSHISYFALNDRPVCTKCRQQYKARIDRATAPGAMTRTVVTGLLTALGCAVGSALLIGLFGMFRIPCAIGTGYLVGKAIANANGGWPGRKYQYLAVSLTWLAFGLAALGSTIANVPAARRLAVQEIRDDSIFMAEAFKQNESLQTYPGREPGGVEVSDDMQKYQAMQADRERRRAHRASTAVVQTAALLRTPLSERLGMILAIFFFVPIVANLTFGLHAAAMGALATAFALRRAWQLTEGGVELELTGPFKPGEGPIRPAF